MEQQNIFQGIEEELRNPYLSREEKLQLIEQTGEKYRQQIQKEYEAYRNKQIAAGILEIGSAAIPVSGAYGQIAKKAIPAVVKSTLGRKFIENTTASAISGAVNGAIFGLGEGLEKDNNPLISAAQSAGSGFAWGGAIGAITNKLATMARANETLTLKELSKEENWGKPVFRKASGDPEQAIQTLMEYQRGFVPNVYNKPGIGKFDIPWGNSKFGLDHALEGRVTQKKFNVTEFINKLPDTIQKGIITKGNPLHPNTGYIETQKVKIAIPESFDGIKRNWMVTTHPQHKSVRKLLEDSKPFQNIAPENGARSFSGLLTRNSINDNLLKYKSPNQIENSVTHTINTAIHTNPKKSYDNTQNNYQIWQSGLQNKNNSPVITQRKINNHNINIDNTYSEAPIVTERKTNNSNNNSFKLQTSEFFNRHKGYHGYKNPISKDSRIFTAEDIGDMTTDEFTDSEKAIRAQWDTIGIPNHRDLIEEAQKGNLFYMNSYTNPDGTKVKPHFRAKSFF